MEYEPGKHILLEGPRDGEIVYEAARLGGLGGRAEGAIGQYRTLAETDLPLVADDMFDRLSFYVKDGLAKIAISQVRSDMIRPGEAESYLREVFRTSSAEEMAPALPYTS